ncbi:DUF308 domain-containing protein [Tsuneonella sp. CC-YZS046]|uniref:HdeD family acid-resistance protein n=1 Tax=Tsuneonella sp. CC-YZS046 TaxID=3042152 RepID=UPI002D7A2460|nr:DUF308 domain-containing protein [Tsuneonella sp. CC-YZS046]WRO68019.1 DUF308 domain-containing protein [Tsuneonella sp. CC-YZS046]
MTETTESPSGQSGQHDRQSPSAGFVVIGMARHNWGWFALRGVLAILLGIAAFLAPGLTLFAFTLVFAAFCFADGIAMLITGIRRAGSGHAPWWTMILPGLAGIAVGVIFLFWPLLSTLAYAIATVLLVAGWAIVTGALQIAAAIRLREEIEGEWILGLAGLFGVVLGLALITLTALQPTLSILSVAWLIGFYAIMTGVMLLMLGLRLRKRAG